MSIRRFVLTLPALVLVLLVLAGVFPGGAAFAEGGGDPLALRFVCDETVASVTVYDPAGLPLPVGADGIHHLTPGTYFYSATAEGYESTGLQAFTIPADAAGDQELHISLTPVPGSVPPGASTPGETPPDASVPGQTPVNAPDPNAPEENPEDDGKLRIRPVDGSLTLTIERETKAESAVPPELQKLLEGKQKPLLTADGKPVEKKLWLKTPDAEELYLDRLAVEKALGYYTTDWTVLNLTDEEGSRKNLVPASGWYDVTVSGPATEPYRAYEPVFALVTLHWDEEGDIVDRDVQILETTHTPTKSSWSFSTDTLSTLVIAVPTDRPVESEEAAAKKDRPAFAASSTVDGVTVTVSAPSGVFPADAALWVQRVPLTEEIDAAVESERDEQKTVAVSYTFDIRVVNPETMEEYQPEEGQNVSVSFALAEVADENLETRVYHVTEEESTGALTAEALDVSESGLTATAETDGFSYYQVEFTYEKLQYVLPGDTSVPLAEILTELGLSGDVTEVSCSNTNLFSCDWTENRWVVTAHRAFSSTEWMKVTLNNVVYEITVTDEQDGDWKFNVVNGGAVITRYNGTGGDVEIPNGLIFNGSEIPVTGIGESAFDGCDSLKSIEIPKSVKSIGDHAFEECGNLEFVTFAAGSNLARIGDSVFYSCGNLWSIEIPASVTSIGGAAFGDCGNLGRVTFAPGSQLARIGGSAFYNCSSLLSIEIPSSVTSIGASAFKYCRILQSIEIPASVSTIGDAAFYGCNELKDIWYHGTEAQWNAISSNNGGAPAATVHYVLSITATSDPPAGGTVTISPNPIEGFQSTYYLDTLVTVTATANSNYAFVNWTENGSVVMGTDGNPVGATYSFTATTDRTLVAHFGQSPTVNLQVTKDFNDWGKADSFTFNLAAVTEGAPMPSNNTTATATATEADPTATFDEIMYDAVGTYEYTITEVNGGADGVSYDTTPHNVVVTVSKDNNTNALSATVKYDGADSLIVTNTFATTTATLQVTKVFEAWGKADSFTFELAAVTEGAPMPSNNTTATATATEADPTATFDEITYDKAGEYQYTITERDDGADGVTYDTTSHKVVVTVTKAEDATNALSATVKYDGQDSLIITNTYSVGSLTVSKTVDSRVAGDTDQEFQFTVELSDKSINGTYGGMTFTNGVAAFSLKDGDTNTASGLSPGITYTVTEEDTAGFTMNKSGDTGTISATQSAATFTNKRIFEYTTDGTSATITKYWGDDASFSIPQTLTVSGGTYPVTAIGEGAFEDCKMLTSVTIPDSVTSIGTNAFSGCLRLASVTFGNSSALTEIGDSAFYGCIRLAGITLPDGVETIGERAFYNCKAFETLTVPDGVTELGAYAFYGCGNLENVTIPDSVTSIGTYAFKSCKSSLVITIDSWKAHIKEPEASWNGTNPVNWLWAKVTATANPDAGGRVSITGGKDVGDGMVFKKSEGSSATVTATANSNYAFVNWTENVNGSVTTVSTDASYSFTPDTDRDLVANFVQKCGDDLTWTLDEKGTLIISGTGAMYDYSDASRAPWYNKRGSITAVSIEDGAKTIGSNAFIHCSSLQSVTIPDSVTEIGESAFRLCTSLPDVALPDQLTTIGSYAFTGCGNLTDVTIPDGVTGIGPCAFHSCGLTSVTIPDSVSVIEEYTFYGCANLDTVTIPESVTTIGKRAFDESGVETVTIPASVTTIGDRAFANSGLEELIYDGTKSEWNGRKVTKDDTWDQNTPDKTIRFLWCDIIVSADPAAGGGAENGGRYKTGTEVILKSVANKGYDFVNWTENGTAVSTDKDYGFTVTEDRTLTANFTQVIYKVTEGKDASWLKGSRDGLSVTVKRSPHDESCFGHFTQLLVDGDAWKDGRDYTAAAGSTVVTLKAKTLNRLSAGKHTLTFAYDDGAAETTLTILVPPGGYSPGTGDSARVGFWAALMVLAGLGFAGADYARRRLRRPRYVGKH